MAAALDVCPICKDDRFRVIGESDGGNRRKIECAICGTFVIGRMAAFRMNGLPPNFQLSAFVRRFNLRSPAEQLAITQEALPDILGRLPVVEIGGRPLELLQSLALMTKTPGERIALIPYADFPLAYAVSGDELLYHLKALARQGYVEIPAAELAGTHHVVVSHEGWAQVENRSPTDSAIAFVAMSFSQQMTTVWSNGLAPGIADAGYEAKRVDSEPHIGRIDLKILADIRSAKFVVCDVTEQKQGVYFEAGFALALGKPIIWTVKGSDIAEVHFDTRQFAHILWEGPDDLRTQLSLLIKGVIGQGPKPIG